MPRYSFTLAGLLALFAPSDLLPGPAAPPRPRIENLNKLPLAFERNQGQTGSQVKFLARGQGYTLFLTSGEAVLALHKASAKSGVLRMKLLGANPAPDVSGMDEMPGKSNYFIGNDAKKWHTNVPMYAKVKYKGVYSGIDLVYYGNQRQLEYDFVVAPGADPRRIQLGVRGARKISRSGDGDLVLAMDEGEICWHKPVVYQEKDGARQEIAAHYAIKSKNRVGFEVAGYDLRRPLFIDPLVYSTYLGGSGADSGYAIAVDSSDNAYVTGATNSTDFPTMNPLQPANAGGALDVFVAKLNPTGSALVYSTYLGGSGEDFGNAIAVDSSGNAYVTGATGSTDFPTVNPLQSTNAGGQNGWDAFVAKLNPTGSALVYSTYLGGGGLDDGNGIAVDSSGSAYVTGQTNSSNFPTMNPLQPTLGGCCNAFAAKINPAGSAFVYSTYLGGSGGDIGYGIAVDSSGNSYITGYTVSTNFPTMNPLQPTIGGGEGTILGDAFVAKLNPAGSGLVYSTYIGGSGDDRGSGIAVDGSGNAYVTGSTGSTDFPTMNPLQPTNGGSNDAFVAKLNSTGSALIYSTYLGGSAADGGGGIAADGSGNAYVTGSTVSTDFPTMSPLQPTNGGGNDAFVAKLNPTGSALVYCTYLGGSGYDSGSGIAADGSGNAYVTGYTTSVDFPTMNPLQPVNGGGGDWDVFVAKIAGGPVLVPPNLSFGNQTVGITSAPKVSTMTNTSDATLTITSINVTGTNSNDFAQTNNCGTSVPAGGSCNITVTFTPSETGTRTAAVSITDSDPTSPQTLPLSGTGVLPALTLSPPTGLTFPNQTINTTSSAMNATLTNTGLGILTVQSIAATGPFAQTNTCSATLNPAASCTISVTFTPNANGTLTGAISVTDNAPGSPQALPLSGVGVSPAVTFSPTILTFPDQTIFTTSAAKKVTLTNTGLGILTVASIAVTGPFAQTNTCSATLNPVSSCTISVTFKPKAKGTLTGSVSVTDNAPGSPQALPLTGTGTYVQLSPASLRFGSQPIGTSSLSKKITLTNKGSATVSIAKISIAGADAGDFAQTNTCGKSVASGASCFITVTFTPTANGRRTAHVSVSDNGGGSPQTAGVSGTGT
jgi:hypothetical protein